MKKFKIITLTILFFMTIQSGYSQTFDCFLANDRFISPTEYQIDVYIRANTTTNFILAQVQHSILFNPALFPSGATVTASFVNGSSQLNNYVSGNVTWRPLGFALQATANPSTDCITMGTLITSNFAVRIATFSLQLPTGQTFNCVPANPSIHSVFDSLIVVAPLKTSVSMYQDLDCITSSIVGISLNGTYTSFPSHTLYGSLHNTTAGITTHPLATGTCPGGAATFFVSSSRSSTPCGTVTYQWLENNIPVSNGATTDGIYSGATDSMLNISNASSALDGHQFSCVVSECCTDTSESATFEVNNNPSANLLGGTTFLLSDSTRVLDAGAGFNSYLWSTGETTQSIIVHSQGTFWVEVTSTGGCTMHDSIEVSGFISINEIGDASDLILFPNPVENVLNISHKNERIISVNVFNLLNQKQKIKFSKSVSGENIQIDISNLPPGVYFVEAMTSIRRIVQKFIKEN